METEFLTKYQAPRRRSDYIPRPRLLQRLQAASEGKLTFVTAPAAYGKTTLLSDFVSESSLPVTWYSIERNDGDATSFLQQVHASVRTAFPQVEPLSLDGFGAGSESLRRQVATLVNMLHRLDVGRFVMAWDDFHNVADNTELLEAVGLFIEHLPENISLVIATRSTPELPVLEKLLAYRQGIVFRGRDMALTVEETQQLLIRLRGEDVPLENAREMHDKAEGWIGGILALESNMDERGLAATPASEESLRYFSMAVLSQFPEEHRRFFLSTSMLPYLSASLCNEVLGTNDSEGILRSAYLKTGFIQKTDGPNQVYRWHDLIREGLEVAFRSRQQGTFVALAQRAADAFTDRNEIEHAVGLMFKTESYECAAFLLAKHSTRFDRGGQWQLLEGWLSSLPDHIVEADPRLLELKARMATRLGDKERAIGYFNQAVEVADSLGDPVLRARVMISRSFTLRLLGYREEAEAGARSAIAALEDTSRGGRELMRAFRLLGAIYLFQGRFTEAERWLVQALPLMPEHPDEYEKALLNASLGWVYVELGRLSDAHTHLENATGQWRNIGNRAQLAVSLNNLGLLWYRHGQYDRARETLDEALECAQLTRFSRTEAVVRVGIGDVERDRGRLEEALEWYNGGLELGRQASEANLVSYATAAIGETYRLKGEGNKAEMMLNQAASLAGSQEQLHEEAMARLSLALLKAGQGSFDAARVQLGKTADLAKQSGSPHDRALLHARSAEVFFLDRDVRQAREHLQQLAELCNALGNSGFLLTEARRAPAVFRWAASEGIGGGFYANLVREAGSCQGEEPALSAARLSLDLRAYGFGKPRVYVGDELITHETWKSPKARELFFYLLVKRQAAAKEAILADIWADSPPESANSNFHSSLRRLRHAVHPALILYADGTYRLNPDFKVWFDLEEFFQKLQRAESLSRGTKGRAKALEEALALCTGPALEDFYAEWSEGLRRQIDGVYLSSLSSLAGFYASQQNFSRAIKLLERAAEYDQLEEEVRLEMMRYYLAAGDPSSAAHVYRSFREVLRDELAEEPSPDLRRLYQEAVAHIAS